MMALVFLYTGCQQHPKALKSDAIRSQELFITSTQNINKLKKGTFFEGSVNLNNTDVTSTDLKIINRGGKPLTINNIELVDNNSVFTVSSSNCQNKILQPHESCTIKVAFDSVQNRLYSANLHIHSNDRRRKVVNIKLHGQSINKYQGSMRISELNSTKNILQDLQLKFNASNRVKLITVSNDGLYPITLEQPKFFGTQKSSYTFDTTCTDTLKVAATCDITISYDKDVHDGYAVAQLKLPSNGNITPSNKIRLIGYSKPYFLNINKFVVSKNIHDFMDDYFATKQTYYVRTIYQNNIDATFQTNIDDAIRQYITDNNYTIATSPDKADKVITLYPNVEIPKVEGEEQTGDMLFDITLNGYVSTKADAKGLVKVGDSINAEENDLLLEHNSSDMRFSSLSTANIYYNKEPFAFALQINVDNVSDKYDVYESIAKTFANKVFNVVGLPQKTGK